MGVTINNKQVNNRTEPPPQNGQQLKSSGGGGGGTKIFALNSAAVEVQEIFSSHGNLQVLIRSKGDIPWADPEGGHKIIWLYVSLEIPARTPLEKKFDPSGPFASRYDHLLNMLSKNK